MFTVQSCSFSFPLQHSCLTRARVREQKRKKFLYSGCCISWWSKEKKLRSYCWPERREPFLWQKDFEIVKQLSLMPSYTECMYMCYYCSVFQKKMYVHPSMSYSFDFYGSFWIKLYYAYALMMTSYMHVFCVILAIKICITKTCSSVRSGDLSDCAIVENFFLGSLHTQEEVSTEYSEHWWCKSKVGEARFVFVFCVVHARQTQWRNKIPLVGWK